jgi:hypothetical protein
MTDAQQDERRDLDVPAGAAQEVKGGKVSVRDVSNTRRAGKPFITGNHNETLVRGGRLIHHNETLMRSYIVNNHNETLVRDFLTANHNETLVQNEQQEELRDLDVPARQAEGVTGGLKAGSSEVLMETVTIVAKPKPPRGSS